MLLKFYLELRKQTQWVDSTPVTTRQLESMVRLTEARARVDLRSVATVEDAADVVDLMRECVGGVGSGAEAMGAGMTGGSGLTAWTNPRGGAANMQPGGDGGGGGKKNSKMSQIQSLVKALHRASAGKASALFTKSELYAVYTELGLTIDDQFDRVVQTLNNQNYLLIKGHGQYQLQSSSFI